MCPRWTTSMIPQRGRGGWRRPGGLWGALLSTRNPWWRPWRRRKDAGREGADCFPRVLIRLRLPDRSMLQGTFTPTSTVGDVRAFLGAHTRPGVRTSLFVTPPKKVLTADRKTLWEEGLVPAAVVWVGVEGVPPGGGEDGVDAASLLTPETIERMEDLPPPTLMLDGLAEPPKDNGKGKGKAKANFLKGLSKR